MEVLDLIRLPDHLLDQVLQLEQNVRLRDRVQDRRQRVLLQGLQLDQIQAVLVLDLAAQTDQRQRVLLLDLAQGLQLDRVQDLPLDQVLVQAQEDLLLDLALVQVRDRVLREAVLDLHTIDLLQVDLLV